MANLTKLIKPEDGQIVSIPAAKDTNLELGFAPTEATLTREGDNLVFGFDGGGKVVVTDFYSTVTKEALPDFIIGEQTVAGADFFAALGEDLQPAAGPAAGANPRGANFNDFDGANVLGGIDSLGGKEFEYNREGEVDRLEARNELVGDDSGGGTGNSGIANETPVITPDIGSLSIVLHDDGLIGGTQSDSGPHTTGGTGSFEIDSKLEGLQSLTIGGKPIDLTADTQSVVVSAAGTVYTVTVTGVNVDAAGKYTVSYSYSLDSAYSHAVGTNTSPDFDIAIVATDISGDTVEGNLTVKILDDAPTAKDDIADDVIEGSSVTGNVLDNDTEGADKWAAGGGVIGLTGGTPSADGSSWTLINDKGTLTLQADGAYTFTSNPNSISSDTSLNFTYTVKDADGDTATATLTLNLTNLMPVIAVESVTEISSTVPADVRYDELDVKLVNGDKVGITTLSPALSEYFEVAYRNGGTYLVVKDGAVDNLGIGQKITIDLDGEHVTIGGQNVSFSAGSKVTFTGNNFNADSVEMSNFAGTATEVTNVYTGEKYTITVTGGAILLGEGDDKLTITDTMAKGGRIEGNEGEDTITAAKMTGGRIEGNAGNDTITVTGNMSGAVGTYTNLKTAGYYTKTAEDREDSTFHIFKDDASGLKVLDKIDNKIIGGAGNDTIVVGGQMENAYIIGDEAFRKDGQVGGDNEITVGSGETAMIGNSSIFGDMDLMGQGTTGGNNTIIVHGNVNLNAANMDLGYKIGQDNVVAGQRNIADGAIGGNDTITVNGSLLRGEVLGEHNVFDMRTDVADDLRSKAGDDIITIKGDVGGGAGSAYVAGEGILYNAIAGSDTITVEGTVKAGAVIVGTYALLADSQGADNTITVGNVAAGTIATNTDTGISSNIVAGVSLVEASKAGNDTITITGNVTGGGVFGEGMLQKDATGGDNTITVKGTLSGGIVAGSHTVTDSTAGNDDITVNKMTGGHVYGDGATMTNSTGGGDSISITTTMSGANSEVHGDAYLMTNSTGGDDTISIGTLSGGYVVGEGSTMVKSVGGDDHIEVTSMTGGTILGDSYYMKEGSTGGNDYIHVGTMSGGNIYGDGHVANMSSDSTGGNDTIVVDLFTGSATRTIDGGGGHDVFIYGGSTAHTLTLNENGTVTGHGVTGLTITNFEGIGGGAGNDTLDARGVTSHGVTLIGGAGSDKLYGGDGNDILYGGAGNDQLYGGAGDDTFVWNVSELGGQDRVQDFGTGDKIVIEGTDAELGNLSAAYVSGSDTIVITGGSVEQTITFSNSDAAAAAMVQLATQIETSLS